jgi:hypothetical protein
VWEIYANNGGYMKISFPRQLLNARCMFCMLFGLLVVSTAVSAKVMDITLAELVKKSEVIYYGHSIVTSTSVQKEYKDTILFKPISVLKGQGDKDQKIHLCKMAASSESYDLAAIKENYIVFAAKDGSCYRPVYLYKSVIKVEGDLAQTWGIDDQPENQPLSQFLEKIQFLVTGTATK